MLVFDANKDGRVHWAEFVGGLGRVEQHLQKQLNTRAPKHNAPKWMTAREPRVLQEHTPHSSARRDAEGARTARAHAPVPCSRAVLRSALSAAP